ncbi:MAG: tripartite tricarboxylate transporter TctB family protein [Betaproteobacteria bacterium]
MEFRIRSPKDFGAGLLYAGFGAAAILMALDYGMGSASRMGAGYFPTALGVLLMVIGIVSLVRSFVSAGAPIGTIAWKPAALVTSSTFLFGLLLRPAGLVPALVVLILVSAFASSRFRLQWRALGLMAALIAFCALVFVKGLGLPVPLLGRWFGG